MLHGIQDFKILLFRKFDLRFYTKLFDVLSDDHPTGIETCRSFYCFNITTRRKMQCISLVNYSRLDIASARHEKHKSANKNSRRLGAVLTERNADLPLNICPNSHVCWDPGEVARYLYSRCSVVIVVIMPRQQNLQLFVTRKCVGFHRFLDSIASSGNYSLFVIRCVPKLRKATFSFMSVCPSARNNSAPTGRILMKLHTCFFVNLSRQFKFHWNLTRKTGTLYKEVFTFMTISH